MFSINHLVSISKDFEIEYLFNVIWCVIEMLPHTVYDVAAILLIAMNT